MHLKKGNNDKQSFDKPNINWKAFQNIRPGAVYSSLSLKNWWFGTVLWLETPWCVFLLQARLGSWCGSGWDGRTAAAGEVISWGLQSLAETPSRRAILRFKLSSTALLQRKLDLWLSGSSGFVTRESKNWRRWGCGGGTSVERFFFLPYFASPWARLDCPRARDRTCPTELTTVKRCCPFSFHNIDNCDET